MNTTDLTITADIATDLNASGNATWNAITTAVNAHDFEADGPVTIDGVTISTWDEATDLQDRLLAEWQRRFAAEAACEVVFTTDAAEAYDVESGQDADAALSAWELAWDKLHAATETITLDEVAR